MGTDPARPGWSRGRLLAVLAGALAVGLILVTGLGLAVYFTLRPSTSSYPPSSPVATSVSVPGGTRPSVTSDLASEDAVAQRPMPAVDLDAAEPGEVSTRDPGTIMLPPSTRVGPDGVPSGYPHTAAGALAQLAAIDQAAMQPANLAAARAVIRVWAARGGPTPQSWSALKAMASFLDAAGLSGGGSPNLTLVVTPLMGLIKGTVGADFVVACVDFEFDATLQTTQRVATADCQRMTWTEDDSDAIDGSAAPAGRWVIGPGAEPAAAPSVWPDTETAVRVGYQDLRHA